MPKETISFRSQPVTVDFLNIDRDAGILREVVLTEIGEASGHGVHLDASFVADVVKQGNEAGKIFARLGHPNACNPAMGKQIGNFRNFQLKDGKAVADLHLLEAAKAMPNGGNAWEWIFSMAEEAPDQINNSIVFSHNGFYQFDEDGKRVDYEYQHEAEYEGDPIYISLGELMKSDLVEDGAATSTLFSSQVNTHLFSVTADQFLDENPLLLTYLQKHPAKVVEYAKKKGIQLESKGLLSQIKALFNAEETIDKAEFERLVINNQQFTEQLTAFENQVTELKAEAEALRAELQEAITLKVDATAKVKELERVIESMDASKFKKKEAKHELGNKKPAWHKDNF